MTSGNLVLPRSVADEFKDLFSTHDMVSILVLKISVQGPTV